MLEGVIVVLIHEYGSMTLVSGPEYGITIEGVEAVWKLDETPIGMEAFHLCPTID